MKLRKRKKVIRYLREDIEHIVNQEVNRYLDLKIDHFISKLNQVGREVDIALFGSDFGTRVQNAASEILPKRIEIHIERMILNKLRDTHNFKALSSEVDRIIKIIKENS